MLERPEPRRLGAAARLAGVLDALHVGQVPLVRAGTGAAVGDVRDGGRADDDAGGQAIPQHVHVMPVHAGPLAGVTSECLRGQGTGTRFGPG